ncbi:hypothetical protein DSO57_1011401 [Entomophthora muscae]|uniref:Uncharacterized protein n=1 Tax=Entomophthora muscae TaxID=34485 RepID=A0ACC2UFQ5_9FUNG|nr:hypothetical protein DSO57_1011401 [Entomophthora muscae]
MFRIQATSMFNTEFNNAKMANEAPEFRQKQGFFQNFKRRFSHDTLHVPAALKINKPRSPSLASIFQSNASSPCLSPATPTSRKSSVCSINSEAVRFNERRFNITSPLPVYEDDIHFQLGYEMRKDQPVSEFDRIITSGYGVTLNGRQLTLQLTLTPDLVNSR